MALVLPVKPAFVDELAVMMSRAFELLQDPEGSSVYLRLSTRTIEQIERSNDA
jgi:pyruvate dehydrogenase E1 component